MMKSGMKYGDIEDRYSAMVMQTIDISMNGKLKILENCHNWGESFLSLKIYTP